MTDQHRPFSLFVSVALGIGAALFMLLLGSGPIAAAPAPAGLNPPLLNKCFARDDSATGTVYQSGDSAAVRQAVAAAVTSDTVRLAGTCDGVAAQSGTTQTVLIDKPLTLAGGYTTTDWADTFPLTQPTTLDAQGLGRVITASADLTIAELTVQNGDSFGGNGGGIFAGGNLTAIGAVNILSNTTLVSTTVDSTSAATLAPSQDAQAEGGGVFETKEMQALLLKRFGSVSVYPTIANNSAENGGGLFILGAADLANAQFSNNKASSDGGGLLGNGDITLNNAQFSSNMAGQYGGAVAANGTLNLNNVFLTYNSALFGGAIATAGDANIQNIQCDNNTATGGGCWTALSASQVHGIGISASKNKAQYGGFLDAFGPFVIIASSRFNDNTGFVQGAVSYFLDTSAIMANNLFIGNTAPQGAVIYAERFSLASEPKVLSIMQAVQLHGLFAGTAATTTGTVNPLASSTAPTGSAFFASGVTLFVTDTIFSGYSLDLETGTAPSSTIVGDYNLFDQTPVISGTGITTGTHSIVGNPLFADNLDHLSAGSPAIDHGINVGIYTDLDGNPRPSGHGFDIGAYEFQVAMQKLFLPLTRK